MSVFGHGQLRLYLLGLLTEGPRHGYDIMRDLEQRFSGMYSPSAGTVYPRLAKLEEEGLVERTDEGRKASYRLTDAGRDEARLRAPEIADLETSLADSAARMAEEMRTRVLAGAADLRSEINAQTAAQPVEEPAGPAPFDLDALMGALGRGSFPDGDAIAAAARRWGITGTRPESDPASGSTSDSTVPAEPVHTEPVDTDLISENDDADDGETVVVAEVIVEEGDSHVVDAQVIEAETIDTPVTKRDTDKDAHETTGRTAPESPLGAAMPNAEQMREVVGILQDAGARIQDVLRRQR